MPGFLAEQRPTLTSPKPPVFALAADQRGETRTGRLRRVLYAIGLNPALKFGSLEEQLFYLARAFEGEGGLFLPLFRSPLGPQARSIYQTAGLRAESLDLETFDFATLRQLIRIIHQNHIEILHWNLYRPVNLYIASLTLLVPRLRHYFTDHNTRELPIRSLPRGPKKTLKRALLRRHSKVLCVSDFVRQCLEAEGVWSAPRTCTHFINTERFRADDVARAHLRKDLGVADSSFVVLVVAQLVSAKGVDVALRALSRVPEHVVAWIVGDGPDAEHLREHCMTLGLEARVRFFGYQVNVSPYMQAADCLVCPTVWAEAAGLVILEALACQLPVIGSAIGGIPEFVEDGRTGLLFPPGDDAQLAARIRRFAGNPVTCRQMGLAGRATVVERFSAEARVGDYLELYRVHAGGGRYGQSTAR